MRPVPVVSIVLALVLSGAYVEPPAYATTSIKGTKSSTDAWPATPAGRAARGWVEAFGSGEAAMREFVSRAMAKKSLEERGVNVRVENYRKLREKYGKLVLASVVKSKPDKLTAKLMASDASLHEFVFTVQPVRPHKLLSVGIRERHGLHGGGGFHH